MIDDMVGLIVDKLKQEGLFEDTIIIYSADHGDCLGAHKLIEKGAFTFEEIYHIPMVVHGAGHEDNDSFVLLQELMPTILDVAGSKPPRPVERAEHFAAYAGVRSKIMDAREVYGELP